ncbi:MAG TPA: DoxX family protein [Woeseiaceae bacterium]|nr:DoxX family protein [Woeseiaceae bacterium]
MMKLTILWQRLVANLELAGAWVALLPIRLLLAWEFGSAGFMKLNGENWFANVQDKFLFPFNVFPADLSWFLATWTEILGAFGLLLGLFTRFWALALTIVSIVAISGVHWPESWDSLSELWKGYAITDKGFGNYRVPLLFIAMLWPLMYLGAGKLSVDRWLGLRAMPQPGASR